MALQVVGSADQNLITKYDDKLKACQQERLAFEKQWYENLSFYNGRQWITAQNTPNGSGGFSLMEQSPSDRWRVRHTANRILRIIRTEVTKLSKEEPQFFCLPDSTEETDRLAAMAGDSIAEYILRTKYFNRVRLEATFWACICGTAFLKNYYDPEKLDLDGLPGRIDFEAVAAPNLFVPDLYETDIQEQPFVIHARTMSEENVFASYGKEVRPDTESASLVDARFFTAMGIKNNKTKKCYVKEVYVKPCKEFEKGAMFVYGDGKILFVHEALPEIDPMLSMMGGGDMGGGMPDIASLMAQMGGQPPTVPPPVNPDQLSLFEHDTFGSPHLNHNEPSKDDQKLNPDPVGKILPPKSDMEGLSGYDHEFPYTHARYPFAKIDHIPTGTFYGDSVIKYLISPQKEYNRTRSIMLENRNMAGKPQWSYTPGSIDPRKFNSKPGLLLAVNLGFEAPKPLEQPALPPNVTNELEVTLRDMDDISSQYEITKGRTPPGVEAASAIAYLSEENDTILYHTVQSLENAVQETGIQVLANVHDYWPEDRIVRMTSKNQSLETREFSKKDLKPIMDFRVETGSMAPRSVAAKQAFITELMKMGALEPKQAMRYLQMSETNKMYEEMMVDERQAQRENVFMAEGQPLYKPDPEAQAQMNPMDPASMQPAYKTDTIRDPMTGEPQINAQGQPATYNVTINPYDAHEIHIQEHENFQKSQEYELLTPDIKQIVQDHVDEHKMELLKERNAAQTDSMMKGGDMESESPRTAPDGPPPDPTQPPMPDMAMA